MAAAVLTYNYSVRDRSGRLVSGTLDGESPTVVASRLKQMGYAPISIEAANTGLKTEIKIPGFGGKVKLKDLSIMARQFATMVSSGLSLLRSLVILSQQTENKVLAGVLGEVRNDVETGASLSASLAKHPKIFPSLMINMAKAGEVGGFLDAAMLQVAENLEKEVHLRGKIKSAMTYPVVVFVFAICAVIGMLLFIVPTFAKMFKTLGAKLPAPTQFLVDASNILKKGFPIFLILVIVGYIAWQKNKHKVGVREFIDPIKLKLPVFGPLFQKVALGRFARNLGTMMHSGVPILQSLDIVGETTGNIVLARAIRDVQNSVRQGESLTGPLVNHPVFPPMIVQMMAVGEDTGALDTMLHKVGDFYDEEVEATTEALTALIEPLMIVFIGSLIGGMIVALYLPIFDIYKHISG
jgi:type IV pilus assembly protein PilC